MDHYGWAINATSVRAIRHFGELDYVSTSIAAPLESATSWDVTAAATTCGLATTIVVWRRATPTLWEALATAVLRQVVRATTARARYWRLVNALSTDGTFPTPARILQADDAQMATLGLRFSWPTLVRLARWTQEHQADQVVSSDEREQLLARVALLKGLGPWTLGIASWDCTNDASRYPAGDYVVQLGARRLWPEQSWSRRPADFYDEWQSHSATDPATFTVLALAASDERHWRRLSSRIGAEAPKVQPPSALAAQP